ncbi:MAG: ABC transporter ATP-binding protein [Deltaproteobacteria bacterium]|nr:ABC transporter ATP-binding protein [Deltaproteobacteria bacterium]
MAVLKVEGLTLEFGGLTALNNVSIQVAEGSICALIGPNGAGKSTLFNCINGIYRGDKGRIFLRGKDITDLPPHKIAKLGVARTYQNLELFSNMTAIENIMVGYHNRIKTNLFTEVFRVGDYHRQEKRFQDRALGIMEMLKITKYRDFMISELPYGILKRVEIARALAMGPSILLLDEPASGMNEQETEEIGQVVLELNRVESIAILLVEHDMSLVMGISDTIYVLNHGEVICSGSPEHVPNNPDVVKAFLGGS